MSERFINAKSQFDEDKKYAETEQDIAIQVVIVNVVACFWVLQTCQKCYHLFQLKQRW